MNQFVIIELVIEISIGLSNLYIGISMQQCPKVVTLFKQSHLISFRIEFHASWSKRRSLWEPLLYFGFVILIGIVGHDKAMINAILNDW